MSRASQLLALMSDGNQYTNNDLCRLAGLSKRECDSTISQLRNAGRLETAPVSHSITPAGLAALAGGRVHAVRKERAAKPAHEPVQIVTHAMLSRPALQAAWMGGANA